jgi:hypothetical protein
VASNWKEYVDGGVTWYLRPSNGWSTLHWVWYYPTLHWVYPSIKEADCASD